MAPLGQTYFLNKSKSYNPLGQKYLNKTKSYKTFWLGYGKYAISHMPVYTGEMHVRVQQSTMSTFQEKLDTIVGETGQGLYQYRTHRHDRHSGTLYKSLTMTTQVRSDKFYQVFDEIRKVVSSVPSMGQERWLHMINDMQLYKLY
jgi:hypothetical protein